MKTLLILVGLFVLLTVCWPLALLALVFWSLAWLITIPLAIIGIHLSAPIALLGVLAACLYLPARRWGRRT